MEELNQFYQRQYPIVLDALSNQLDKRYLYHGLRHTLDVIEQSEIIAISSGCNSQDIAILKNASLFHDLGFLQTRKGHEVASAEMFEFAAKDSLSLDSIEKIKSCILATTMPQTPNTLLERIICDADLDYLGRDDFEKISFDLFQELLSCGEIESQEKWDAIQVVFLDKHEFHTSFNQNRRNKMKLGNLNNIKKRLSA